MQVGSHSVEFPYFTEPNRSLTEPDPTVRRIVLVIHGISHNADDYFRYGNDAKYMVPGAPAETLVAGLQVLRLNYPNDHRAFLHHTVKGNLLYWRISPFWGSQQANYGEDNTQINLSVFQVLDTLISDIVFSGRFPNLHTVVLFGYSGGGQLVQRYAATGRFDHEAASAAGVHLRYGVGAPSSYVYMDDYRPVTGQLGNFVRLTAADKSACSSVDSYGSGIGSISYSYVNATGAARIRAQFKDRIVGYIVGGSDNDPNSSSLATGCAAMWQGRERVERMVQFYEYLKFYYGREITRRHVMWVEPGITHNGRRIIQSPSGLRLLFDYDPRDSDGDGVSDWDEWKAGTDPHDASSFPMEVSERSEEGAVQLRWDGQAVRRYTIESWTQAEGWVAGPSLAGVDGEMTWDLPLPGPHPAIHRLRIQLD